MPANDCFDFRLRFCRFLRGPFALALLALVLGTAAFAQETTQQQPAKQPTPEADSGPTGDLGPYAIPKKKDEETKAPLPPPAPPKIEGMPDYTISVNVPLVNVDTMVLTRDGMPIPGLKKEHFRVLEDGVEQKVTNFSVTQAPFTAVLLIEFGASNYRFMQDALNAAYAFADQLRPNDYVAVVEFDMKSTILVDFTNDKKAVYGALNMLRVPGFREANVFDALYDTLDRLDRIEGRKEIILVASGIDTFSRITYDKVLKKIKDTPNVTIFPISTGFLYRNYLGMNQSFGATLANMDFLQADNQMQTYARMTGGRFFQPRFQGELPSDFREISDSVRNQYTLSYHPTNSKLDGTFRKLKVEVVAPGTDKPLIIKDQKNKELKYRVVAREGYTAKRQVE